MVAVFDSPVAFAPLRWGDVSLRLIRLRDTKTIQQLRDQNRAWLEPWEATNPDGQPVGDVRSSIRNLLTMNRTGFAVPFVIEYRGQIAGQLNVAQITYGSLSSASIGYWVAKEYAGHGVAPLSVALATDYCFVELGLHRVEICIRPENQKSLRVVEKVGYRYEGYRQRYINIAGSWADHYAFALVSEDVPDGAVSRYVNGEVPEGIATPPK